MVNVCNHLRMLLRDVYHATYGESATSRVDFIIRPMSRLEVTNVAELQLLLDSGLVSFDNAMHLSNLILGTDIKHGCGRDANAGQFSRMFVTPENKQKLAPPAKK